MKKTKSKIICFPHIGDYYVPIKYLFSHILNCEIMVPRKISNKTLELGTKYSPDFVCMPFKYTLGEYIECLEDGANILFQLGGGCRYGYYSELQKQILEDLGYEFEMINFITAGETNLKKIFKQLKNIDPNFKKIKSMHYLFLTIKMIKYMDSIDFIIRENIGFEIETGSFDKLKKQMLKDFSKTKSFLNLYFMYKKYKRKFKCIPISKKNPIKIGIIGELYTVMEPFSNYFLEYELAKNNIEIKRFTNAHYLLVEKRKKEKKYLKNNGYVKYKMGADALDNIYRCKYLIENNYDGIIHIKSSFCTPEIGAMPIINKICNEHDMPVLFFSFDSNTSEIGIKTRLEAFYDMLEMRRNK